jgi:hypothetical protein
MVEVSMGHLSRVSQAIGQINRQPGRRHEQIKRRLSRTAGKEQPHEHTMQFQ